MKAQTFLEWLKGFLDTVLDDPIKALDKIRKIMNFYSQSFRPEMITELFEGWEIRKRNEGIGMDYTTYSIIKKNPNFYNEWRQSGFHVLETSYELEFLTDCDDYSIEPKEFYIDYQHQEKGKQQYSSEYYHILIPQTLNDFISDCNRAGIELEWKPEIIKQYFK